MHGTFEGRRETSDKSIRRRLGSRIPGHPDLHCIALVALMITQPDASKWISEAAQAEFAGRL